jgi:hypothetical protein
VGVILPLPGRVGTHFYLILSRRLLIHVEAAIYSVAAAESGAHVLSWVIWATTQRVCG